MGCSDPVKGGNCFLIPQLSTSGKHSGRITVCQRYETHVAPVCRGLCDLLTHIQMWGVFSRQHECKTLLMLHMSGWSWGNSVNCNQAVNWWLVWILQWYLIMCPVMSAHGVAMATSAIYIGHLLSVRWVWRNWAAVQPLPSNSQLK